MEIGTCLLILVAVIASCISVLGEALPHRSVKDFLNGGPHDIPPEVKKAPKKKKEEKIDVSPTPRIGPITFDDEGIDISKFDHFKSTVRIMNNMVSLWEKLKLNECPQDDSLAKSDDPLAKTINSVRTSFCGKSRNIPQQEDRQQDVYGMKRDLDQKVDKIAPVIRYLLPEINISENLLRSRITPSVISDLKDLLRKIFNKNEKNYENDNKSTTPRSVEDDETRNIKIFTSNPETPVTSVTRSITASTTPAPEEEATPHNPQNYYRNSHGEINDRVVDIKRLIKRNLKNRRYLPISRF